MPVTTTTPPPLYLTGPARRIAAIEDPTERHAAACEAAGERLHELDQYRKLYREQYGASLSEAALEGRDPYLQELHQLALLAGLEAGRRP